MIQKKCTLRIDEQISSFLLISALCLHAVILGLSDDEAYYWALSRQVRTGYAFHPPGVVWSIAFVCHLFGDYAVRLAPCLGSIAVFLLARRWVAHFGVRLFWPLLGFAGFWAFAWMAVPDNLLFIGLMLLMLGVCEYRAWQLVLGALLVLVAKFSGVLAIASACYLLVQQKKWRALGFLGLGTLLGLAPSFYWNVTHDFLPLLYQLRDRHGGGFSWTRWGLFIGSQLLLLGPWIFFLRRQMSQAMIFALPPLMVYCIQPLFADFKPHWALVGWWPLFLHTIVHVPAIRRMQTWYGGLLAVVMVLACYGPFPLAQDASGWEQLVVPPSLPVVALRYQTASQAAYALRDRPVYLLPRSLKEYPEWPSGVGIVDSDGPGWPRLLRPIVVVGSSVYPPRPEFLGATCELERTIETRNLLGFLGQSLIVLRCNPS